MNNLDIKTILIGGLTRKYAIIDIITIAIKLVMYTNIIFLDVRQVRYFIRNIFHIEKY